MIRIATTPLITSIMAAVSEKLRILCFHGWKQVRGNNRQK